MIYSSLAVLALAASSAISSAAGAPSLGSLVHLHPHTQTDSRVTVTVVNKTNNFVDLKIQGATYTVHSHQSLFIKAPAGTVVYNNSFMQRHRKGDAILAITPQVNNTRVILD